MARSPLHGRRIHISGSVANDLKIAPTSEVEAARVLITQLIKELVKRGANFVIPRLELRNRLSGFNASDR